MPEAVAQAYNSLNAYEQKEVMDFIYFIISRRDVGDEPNEETALAIENARNGIGMHGPFKTTKEFFEDLDADD